MNVLITGSSSGIGLEIAKVFAANKYDLVLVARSAEILEKLRIEIKDQYRVKVYTSVRDLSDESSYQQLYDELQAKNIHIDVLVNNAGFATFGNFSEIPYDNDLGQIEVNIISLTLLTKIFLKDMIKNKSGYILNVASIAAFLPGPLMSVYYATKAYVMSFSLGLREELKGTGVKVSVLCPGPTKTNFTHIAHMDNSKLFSTGAMSADIVAKVAYQGLMNNKDVIIPGIHNKLVAFFSRLISKSFAARMTKEAQSLKN